ncbi:hypothetical protein BC332_18307 [Capsicum chinense]|nr:hypothetical protein BC332_18307 [Capsicum chinense]
MEKLCSLIGTCSTTFIQKPSITAQPRRLVVNLYMLDGTILRASFPGRPTKDFLLTDPSRDGVSSVFRFHH